ncbi:hypothetical protein ACU4GD_42970 [Cupriavidus basilensis]
MSCDTLGDQLALASEDAGLDLRFLQRVEDARRCWLLSARSTRRSNFFVGDDSADLYFDPACLAAGLAPGRAHGALRFR